MNVLNLMDYVT